MLNRQADTECLSVLAQFRQEQSALFLANLVCRPVFKHVANFIDLFAQFLAHSLSNEAARWNEADLAKLEAIRLEKFVNLGIRVLPTHHKLHE